MPLVHDSDLVPSQTEPHGVEGKHKTVLHLSFTDVAEHSFDTRHRVRATEGIS